MIYLCIGCPAIITVRSVTFFGKRLKTSTFLDIIRYLTKSSNEFFTKEKKESQYAKS